MNSLYAVLDGVKDHFKGNTITNTVSYGDDSKLDLNKTTIFPLAHFDVNRVEFSDNYVIFTLYVLCLGIVDQDWAEETEDEFYDGNNEQDVMNEQLFALMGLVESLRRGTLYRNNIRLYVQPSAQPVNAFDDSQIAGWASEIQITVPKDYSIC